MVAVVAVLVTLGVSAGSAAATKVLLKYGATTATSGETVLMFETVSFATETSSCSAEEGAAKLGTNPSGTAKIIGALVDVPGKSCKSEGAVAKGVFTNKQVMIKKTGATSWLGSVAVETKGGCHYEVKKLSGTETFPSFVEDKMTGTAKLQKKGVTNPVSCAKTVPAEGTFDIGSLGAFTEYEASLIT